MTDDCPINDDMLDRICWFTVDELDRWGPPDETAERCISARRDYQHVHGELDDEELGWERGYHNGAFDVFERFSFFLDRYDIDVLERAERYRRIHDLPDLELDARCIDFIDNDWSSPRR